LTVKKRWSFLKPKFQVNNLIYLCHNIYLLDWNSTCKSCQNCFTVSLGCWFTFNKYSFNNFQSKITFVTKRAILIMRFCYVMPNLYIVYVRYLHLLYVVNSSFLCPYLINAAFVDLYFKFIKILKDYPFIHKCHDLFRFICNLV
jgi:hypothetical protein